MKNIFCLSLILITFFTSCRDESIERQLINEAEAILQQKPDSAYMLLDSITMADNLSDKLLARWCMLYGKAADKVYKDMPYVSQLKRARTWYEKHGTPYEQAQIGLYLGRSYVEDREYMKAMDAYVQALNVAEKAKEYNVAGYICSYMGDLYELKGLSTESFKKYNQSGNYFLKAGNKRSYALALKYAARSLAVEDSCSLALEYLLKADSVVTDLQDMNAISSIANGLGNVYAMLGNMDKAETYLLKSLEANILDRSPNYLALSDLYIEKGDFEKARYYLDKSKTPTANEDTPIAALYTEYEIEKKCNNIQLALSHLEQYVDKLDSVYNSSINLDILDAEKRYDHVLLLNENTKLYHNNLINIFFINIIVIIGLILFLVYLYKNKEKNRRLYEQEIKLKENDIKIYELSSELERKKSELSLQNSLESNEKRLKNIKNDIAGIENEIILLRKEKLSSSLIAKKIIKLSQKVVAGSDKSLLTNKDWATIQTTIDQIYTSFKKLLDSVELTASEKSYCYLSFFELDIKAESILLNINPLSVTKRRYRIRQKFGITGEDISLYKYFLSKM